MAVETVRRYTCDLCGEYIEESGLVRFGVRKVTDRPEDAGNVDVGTCCMNHPVIDVYSKAVEMYGVPGE